MMSLEQDNSTIRQIYTAYQECDMVVSTDSRKIHMGSLFVALKGGNFDGNDFALSALKAGAKYCVVSEARLADKDSRCILVEDTLIALQQLAHYHRMQRHDIPIIGITGTNGKTTTKELLASCLSQALDVLYTEGNLNNHIGVPLTLLRLRDHHRAAIIEMGASKPGDIRELCEIAEPTIGVITNVGKAHLQGFGSIEGVLKAKSELFRHLVNHGRHFILNQDDSLLRKKWRTGYGQSYGTLALTKRGYMQGTVVSNSPCLAMQVAFEDKAYPVHTHLVGAYNAHNVLAAVSVATSVGLDIESAIKGVVEYTPANHRSQLITGTEDRSIIADAYNANPSSMMVALQNLSSTKAQHRIALLGDMRELGDESQAEHTAIVEWLQAHPEVEGVVTGHEFGQVVKGTTKHFRDTEELRTWLDGSAHFLPDTVVLLKGSNGMALEKLIPTLQNMIGIPTDGE